MSSALTDPPRPEPRPGLLTRVWSAIVNRPAAALDHTAAVWGLDAAGNPARTPPAVALPPRAERAHGAPQQRQAEPERIYLMVPFAAKDQAKSAGARWDKDRKAWFTHAGRDNAALASWMPMREEPAPAPSAVREPGAKVATVPQVLEVPFADKNDAKALGARWDNAARAWYVPAGVNLAPFEAWLPGKQKAADPVAEFGEALRRAGLDVPEPQMDGKLHRVPVQGDKGRERSGAYVGHLDGRRAAGFIQNFKTDEKIKWRQDQPDRASDKADAAKWVAEREARKVVQQEQEAQSRLAAARVAQAVWDRALAAPDTHPYLSRKEVDGQGLRVGAPGQTIAVSDGKGGTRDMGIAGWLIAPVQTAEAGLSSLQFISPEPDGGKVFLPGGRMQGGHHVVGQIGRGAPILVCEGVATGKTLHALTGLPVVVSFNAGNMRETVGLFAAIYPERTILVAGDNDHKREREIDPRTGKPKENVGKTRAMEAAAAVGGVALLPPFSAHERGSDWNDLAKLRGPATTRSLLREMVAEAERGPARQERVNAREAANVIPFERRQSQERQAGRGAGAEMER